ncbi:MAG: D-alanyl-D-alanine carboxypeptidase [Hyphomicrobium sp.]|nr:D-alanyl-D-alanine carboxypeptidase [Hyphomicrobium sp.]
MRSRTALLGACALSLALSSAPAVAGPALLFEPSNGKLLYAEDPDSLWHPASLTKIMTAYVTFQAIKAGKLTLEQKIPCSLVATLQPPSKVGLNVGAEMSVEKALQAVIIKSANDVTVMLAEAVSGSETKFVADMNAVAKKLGMTRTNFVNTNGLPDPGQITTARDLAKLSRAVVSEFPEYASYWSMTDMRIGNRRLGSHNALLKTFPGADGLKTGFTCDSGFNVVASATRDGRRLMAVVLGETSGNERAVRAASLLEHGFQSYGWKDLFNQTNIDSLPLDPSAKGVTTVREHVVSWDCGNGRRRRATGTVVARNKALKAKVAAAKAKAGAKKKDDVKEARPVLKGTQITPAVTAQPPAAKAAAAKTN